MPRPPEQERPLAQLVLLGAESRVADVTQRCSRSHGGGRCPRLARPGRKQCAECASNALRSIHGAIARGMCRQCRGAQSDSPNRLCRRCWFGQVAVRRLGSCRHGPALADLFNAQRGRCALTGVPLRIEPGPVTLDSASLDHIVPSSRGGSNDPSNCRWVTAQVNSAKGSGTDDELLAMARSLLRVAGELKTASTARAA